VALVEVERNIYNVTVGKLKVRETTWILRFNCEARRILYMVQIKKKKNFCGILILVADHINTDIRTAL